MLDWARRKASTWTLVVRVQGLFLPSRSPRLAAVIGRPSARMYAPDAERTDAPTPEQSPSCGTFGAAEAMHASNAHAVEPPAEETPRTDTVVAALREDRPAEYREKHALEVSS